MPHICSFRKPVSLKMSITTKAYLGWLLLLGILTSGSMVKGTMSMMMIERSERENSAVQEFEPL